MVHKIDNILSKTVKTKAIKTAQALAAFCPSNLQTNKMLTSTCMHESIPLVKASEWDRYIFMFWLGFQVQLLFSFCFSQWKATPCTLPCLPNNPHHLQMMVALPGGRLALMSFPPWQRWLLPICWPLAHQPKQNGLFRFWVIAWLTFWHECLRMVWL